MGRTGVMDDEGQASEGYMGRTGVMDDEGQASEGYMGRTGVMDDEGQASSPSTLGVDVRPAHAYLQCSWPSSRSPTWRTYRRGRQALHWGGREASSRLSPHWTRLQGGPAALACLTPSCRDEASRIRGMRQAAFVTG